MQSTRLFTVGYEGKTIREYITALKAAKVDILADVRRLPLSRKKGFSKTPLSLVCEKQGIEYRHIARAGNRSASVAAFARRPTGVDELADLIRGAGRRRVALTCVEADPANCHRSVLVNQLAKRLRGLRVVHL